MPGPRLMKNDYGRIVGTDVERRQAPRIDAFGQLHGVIAEQNQRVVVLDISTGGLGLATREALPVGSVHTVRLTTRDGHETACEVRVMNQREAVTPAGTTYHVVGVQLTHESNALNEIIDHLIGALSFDIDVA